MTNTTPRTISFSPPDITQAEVDRVAEALRSGWITTGPATKQLEEKLRGFTGAAGVACLNSATASLEVLLRILGIGPGDEVVVPAYTYTATASPVCHVGATLVLCDVQPDSVRLDLDQLSRLVGPRTKAVVGVDIGGIIEDYEGIARVLDGLKDTWSPTGVWQQAFERPIVIADAAHSLGATLAGKPSGSIADFSTFSFHAVKNFTTAEGGALAWKAAGFDSDEFYQQVMLYSLHGQTKDALSKQMAGAWEYDIAFPGYKCNMTDIQAALGLAQFERYPQLLCRRREIIAQYERNLADAPVWIMPHSTEHATSSGHLMITRIEAAGNEQRDAVIAWMADHGVAANVHYKPLPLLSAYRDLGFDSVDFPCALAFFQNEVTLPLHTLLSDEDVDYVCQVYIKALLECL